ncbi:hypothetical protein [Lentzea sp. HUAS12]|uniref:hypothetical protein n=1 Tax=Lentzea sp. HUAS12 TaxID=2951806 RepID=UPI00209DEC14|nr:hypothetical protein [Lentzea sp. HUAS12]USX52209.1 hypothetical protein ND450_43990 [Lentzea sp. HUAS12]
MTSTLPPPRDLPPGRHAGIRAELERAARGRRGASRLTVPLLAAAAAVAVVTAGVVLLRPGPAEPTPAVHITTSPTSAPKARDTFGLTPERIAAIEEGCARSSAVPGKLTLHQYDVAGTDGYAFLYTDKAYVSCQIGRGGREYRAGGFQPVYVGWLAGHFAMDAGGSFPGGDTNRNFPELAGAPGYRIQAGRVDPSVARVTYRAQDGRTAEARIANGTYLVRMLYPSTWTAAGDENGSSETRFYDAAGNLLGTGGEQEQQCWTMPGTDITLPDHDPIGKVETATKKCRPAPAWEWR